MEAFSEDQNSRLEALQEKYNRLLWQRAEELAAIRTPLTELQMKLFEEAEEMRVRKLNLHDQELLEQKEAEYWRVSGKIQDIIGQEDRIVEALGNVSNGIIDKPKLQDLAPEPPSDTPELSKKKQRIMEEKKRLGFDPREIDWDLFSEFGSNPTNLSSGNNRRSVKGNFNVAWASRDFFDQTVDTHGGKVSHGKKAGYYTTKDGKKIRKK